MCCGSGTIKSVRTRQRLEINLVCVGEKAFVATLTSILSLPKGEADFVRRRRNKRGGTSKCEKTAQAVSSKSQKILAAITDLSVTAFLSTHLHYPRYAWFIPFWTLMIEICLGFGDWDLDLESEFGNWIWSFRLDH